ncbi:ABC transporter permease [Thermovibrio ammonificans]
MFSLEVDRLIYYRDLLIELIKKDIKVRYKNSYLGYFWSLANPLAMALIFYFIFKIITKVKMENYTLFLISGLFVWQWISNSILAAATIYINNSSLIKKVNFPRNFLVLSLVFSEGFNFLVSIPVILMFCLYYHQKISLLLWLFAIPLLLIPTVVFIYSVALTVGTVNLFFRDMERLVNLLLTFLFYLTPIIYPISMVPEKYKTLIYLNPFVPFALIWQKLFFWNTFDIKSYAVATLYSVVALAISTKIYNKLKYKFAELV